MWWVVFVHDHYRINYTSTSICDFDFFKLLLAKFKEAYSLQNLQIYWMLLVMFWICLAYDRRVSTQQPELDCIFNHMFNLPYWDPRCVCSSTRRLQEHWFSYCLHRLFSSTSLDNVAIIHSINLPLHEALIHICMPRAAMCNYTCWRLDSWYGVKQNMQPHQVIKQDNNINYPWGTSYKNKPVF